MTRQAEARADFYGNRPDISAASLRAAIRGEIMPIDVTATSKTFVVPDAWKGSLVRIQADGGDIYYQISTTATQATCAIAARATEAGTPIVLTGPAAGGCVKIPKETGEDIAFPADAQTFALVTAVTCVARCHLSET
jgi:hypothetical protein